MHGLARIRRAGLAALALLTAVAVLIGCGGGSGERKRIASVLSSGLTSHDPRVVCEGSLSPGLLLRIYGGAAKCHEVESDPGEQISQAQSVEVRGVAVHGGHATAVVVIHGGHHDGASGALRLDRRPTGWRVSDLSVPLLRSQFEASIRRLQTIDGTLKDCIVLKMRKLDDVQFKRLAYGSDASAHAQLTSVARRCAALIAAGDQLAL